MKRFFISVLLAVAACVSMAQTNVPPYPAGTTSFPGLTIAPYFGIPSAPSGSCIGADGTGSYNCALKSEASTAIRYVAVNGNDNNDGLSWGSAKATIKNAVLSLPKVSVTNTPIGSVYIGTGVNITSGNEITIGPWTRLYFNPSNTVQYNGTSFAITCDDATTSNGTTYDGLGGIFGLSLNVTQNSGSGIDIKECTWFQLSNISIEGAGSSSTGFGIELENVTGTNYWTEQSDFFNVRVSNFVDGIVLEDNCTGNSGCPSFSYARWRHIVISPVGTGAVGLLLKNDVNLNGSDLELQCFGNGTTAITCLSLTSSSNIEYNRFKLGGESSGSVTNTGISTVTGTNFAPFSFTERWNSTNFIDSFASGTFTPYIYSISDEGQILGNPAGLSVGNTTNGYTSTIDTTGLTNYRTNKMPDISGTLLGGISSSGSMMTGAPHVTIGTVQLNGASPSTASYTFTGTDVFTSGGSFRCASGNVSTGSVNIGNTDGSHISLTGPNASTAYIDFICVGN